MFWDRAFNLLAMVLITLRIESPAARVVFLLLCNPYSRLPAPAIVTICYILWRLLTSTDEHVEKEALLQG